MSNFLTKTHASPKCNGTSLFRSSKTTSMAWYACILVLKLAETCNIDLWAGELQHFNDPILPARSLD